MLPAIRYLLSLSSKTHKGEACQSHSINYFRSANSEPREPIWCGNVSLPQNECQCHRSVSVAHLAALLVTTSVVWTRPGSACIYIYNKEGSISDDEEEDVCFKRPSIQAYFHLNIKSRSNTVPSMLINISCWSLLEEEILMLMENLMCLWWSAM